MPLTALAHKTKSHARRRTAADDDDSENVPSSSDAEEGSDSGDDYVDHTDAISDIERQGNVATGWQEKLDESEFRGKTELFREFNLSRSGKGRVAFKSLH